MPAALSSNTIPVRRHDYELHADGLVTVLVPKFTGALARRFLVPLLRQPCIRMHLDAGGSAVWQAMDGHTSVARLAALVRERFGGSEDDALQRVALYLRHLAREGSVTLRAPDEDVGQA